MVRNLHDIVNRLRDGVFDYDNGKLSFSVTKIEESLPVGGTYEGSFTIESRNDNVVVGKVYTSSMRLVCMTESFEAKKVNVGFLFDATGLDAGDIVKGDVQIVSNMGEYYIPFAFSIVHGIVRSSLGNVKNLFHFTNQAQISWDEAVGLFYSKEFMQVFEGNDRVHLAKYRGLSNHYLDEQNMDTFLISVNKKQPVLYSVDKTMHEFHEVSETLRCELPVRKSTWGYVNLKLSTDCEFLRLEKTELDYSDFLGNVHKLVFFIEEDKMHEGKNFGRITLTSNHQKLTVTIIASKRMSNAALRCERREIRNLYGRLMRCYIAFRTKHISVNTWVRDSFKIVERLNALDEKNPESRLFQAQLMLVSQRYNEAKWILDHVETEMRIQKTDPTLYCYYLYLTTLYLRDDAYINEVADEVAAIFENNNDNYKILWALLYLNEDLCNNHIRKIELIEDQFYKGCRSPIMYVEAYQFFVNNPVTLNKLEDFELQVLYWAVKNGMMNQEVCKQILYLTARTKVFSDNLLRLLTGIYRITEDADVVSSICSLLIKGNKTDEKYFEWYSIGVNLELRITKLYEYYMLSVPKDYNELLPKSVIMYFGFRNNMDYKHIAFLYANMLRHRYDISNLCEDYAVAMHDFVIEQIVYERIDDNLAYLYSELLRPDDIEPDMVNRFIKLVFSHEVRVNAPNIKNVCVVQDEMEYEEIYAVEDNVAYPVIYSTHYMIFYEDGEGKRVLADPSQCRKLIDETIYVNELRHYVTDNEGFNLYLCSGRKHYITVDSGNVDSCRELVEAMRIKEDFKRDVRMELLKYYYDNNEISTLDQFLLSIEPKVLGAKDRADLVGYLVIRGMFETAYDIITIYGAEKVPAKTLVRICTHMIGKSEDIVDVMLVKVAYFAFINGKYDGTMLKYLVDNFNGLTKELRNLWRAAMQFDIECFGLMEKILVQMLFTKTTIGEKEDLFEEYIRCGSNTKVELAYLSYSAFDYFAKERLLDVRVFDHIVKNYRRGEELNDACKLALLKYYAEDEKRYSDRIREMLVEFLKEFIQKNIYFVFFNEFIDIMPELAVYDDKTIIEYRTDPNSKVTLHYIIEGNEDDDSYHTEEMKNMYGGVFSKEFILFFGENLQYYITEEKNGKESLTFSDSVSISDAIAESRESRYNLLNDMVVSKALQDDETLMKIMEEYVEAECFTDKVFTCL